MHLGGGSLQDIGSQAFGQAEPVDSTVHAGLGGLDRCVLLVAAQAKL